MRCLREQKHEASELIMQIKSKWTISQDGKHLWNKKGQARVKIERKCVRILSSIKKVKSEDAANVEEADSNTDILLDRMKNHSEISMDNRAALNNEDDDYEHIKLAVGVDASVDNCEIAIEGVIHDDNKNENIAISRCT